jgi:hypothetical protein
MAAGPAAREAPMDADHISLVRTGAPYQSGCWEGDVAALPEAEQRELAALLAAAEAEAGAAPPAASAPDALAYAITVSGPGGMRTLRAGDASMTPAFQRLEAWLRAHLPRQPPATR